MATKKTTKSTKGTKTAGKKAKPAASEFVPQATHLPELPKVSSRALAGLAAKIKKAKDVYRKRDAIQDLVDYGERAVFYGALLRHGVVPFWDEPELWDDLAEQRRHAPEAIKPADVATLLSKITRFERSKREETTRILPSWPKTLDDLTLPAYLEDPSAFAASSSWAAPVKKGFATVLVRAGALPREALGPNFVRDLANLHLEGYGLPAQPGFVQDGAFFYYDEMYDKENHPAQDFWDFIGIFTSKEAFLAALDEAASQPAFLEEHKSSLMRQQIDVLRRAPIDRLGKHLSMTGLDDSSRRLVQALFEARNDTPAALFTLARDLKGKEAMKSEIALVHGVLRAKERGEPVAADIDELFSFNSVHMGFKPIDPVSGVTELVSALRVLGRDRARAIGLRLVELEFALGDFFPLLHAFIEERDILDRAFVRLASYEYVGREVFMGIALFPKSALDLLAEKHDEVQAQGGAARAEFVRRGIQGLLAKLAERGETWETRFDRFLDVHGFEVGVDGKPLYNVDSEYSSYVAPVVLVAVTALSPERRRAWLAVNIDPEKPAFARVLAAVPRDDHALLAEMFATIAVHHERVRQANRDWLSDLARDLGDRALPHARALLEATKSQRFRKSFDDALGKEKVAQALVGSAAADVREETKIEKIVRLSKAVAGGTEPITLLQRANDDDEDEDEDAAPVDVGVSRIGGPGFDLGERQPKHDSEPMTHILTLATADAPSLQLIYPNAAAVALYVANPDMNEAYSPYNDETEVVVLSLEDVARGLAAETPKDLRQSALRATTIDVPRSAFFPGDDPKARELRDAIYQLGGRAGGEPLWLQGEEDAGEFLFQLDESLADLNLGDCGVMYVFDDTAFWQCH